SRRTSDSRKSQIRRAKIRLIEQVKDRPADPAQEGEDGEAGHDSPQQLLARALLERVVERRLLGARRVDARAKIEADDVLGLAIAALRDAAEPRVRQRTLAATAPRRLPFAARGERAEAEREELQRAAIGEAAAREEEAAEHRGEGEREER